MQLQREEESGTKWNNSLLLKYLDFLSICVPLMFLSFIRWVSFQREFVCLIALAQQHVVPVSKVREVSRTAD